MIQYCVSKTKDPDWNTIPAALLQHTGWLKINDVTAKAQIYHDEQNLYVRMEARETDIRASVVDPLEQVCMDSCLEFFFAPLEKDFRYFNFEFNPLGTMYLGFGGARETRVRQFPGNVEQFRIRPFYTETGWGITFCLPLKFIKMYFPEFSFQCISACNFYKCGEETVSPHYLSWSKLLCDTPDFHRREYFGKIIYE